LPRNGASNRSSSWLDPEAGTLEYASYGETKALCAEARRLADIAYQSVMDNYEGWPL
jgi:hypothetical protein